MQYLTGKNGFLGSHLFTKLKGDVVAIPHDEIATTYLAPCQAPVLTYPIIYDSILPV